MAPVFVIFASPIFLKEKLTLKQIICSFSAIFGMVLVSGVFEVGFKNLFKLISYSNVEYIADLPRLPRSVIEEHREGLILGSACLNGEIFDLMSRESDEKVQEAMKFYDFIEVQPLPNYSWLVDTQRSESEETVKRTVLDIINNGWTN